MSPGVRVGFSCTPSGSGSRHCAPVSLSGVALWATQPDVPMLPSTLHHPRAPTPQHADMHAGVAPAGVAAGQHVPLTLGMPADNTTWLGAGDGATTAVVTATGAESPARHNSKASSSQLRYSTSRGAYASRREGGCKTLISLPSKTKSPLSRHCSPRSPRPSPWKDRGNYRLAPQRTGRIKG